MANIALLDGRPSTLEQVRSEPFRLFFPLAFLLGILGVAHWVLLSVGAISRYLAAFHAVNQMQAFMLAFASGFLLTAIPKRTGSRPASLTEIGLLLGLLPTVSLAMLFGATAISQLAYVAALVVLVQFAVRRFVSRLAGRRPPPSFVLVPLGLAAGVAGAGMLIASEILADPVWLYPLGRSLVLEGVFLCLALGIGPFFMAIALHGDPPADIRTGTAPLAYLLAGALVIGGLVLHAHGAVRAGLWLRGSVAAMVLLASSASRWPTRPGRNRRLLFFAVWLIPLGLLVAAVFPEHRVAAMHVTFIGGFGTLAFAVATHVTLGHGAYVTEQDGRPRAIVWFGALFAGAMLLRSIGVVASPRYFEVLGVAAVVWLAAATIWALFALPKMWTASERRLP